MKCGACFKSSETLCQIKRTPLETISSYLSVRILFRSPVSLRLRWKNLLYLTWGCIFAHQLQRKCWHQRVPYLPFASCFSLFICLCFYKHSMRALRGAFCGFGSWMFLFWFLSFFCSIAAVAGIDINLSLNRGWRLKDSLTLNSCDLIQVKHVNISSGSMQAFYLTPHHYIWSTQKVYVCVCLTSGSDENTTALQLME